MNIEQIAQRLSDPREGSTMSGADFIGALFFLWLLIKFKGWLMSLVPDKYTPPGFGRDV